MVLLEIKHPEREERRVQLLRLIDNLRVHVDAGEIESLCVLGHHWSGHSVTLFSPTDDFPRRLGCLEILRARMLAHYIDEIGHNACE